MRAGLLRVLACAAALAGGPAGLSAQQAADDAFRFPNAAPAFAADGGPVVCIDAAHNNKHRAAGTFRPFARLLADDGFRIRPLGEKLAAPALAGCGVLVIANPEADANRDDWAFPHPSAFNRGEIDALHRWVRGGGALFLVVDHDPFVGAAADLALTFGIVMLRGQARDRQEDIYDLFTRDSGQLLDHPITRGRNPKERIDRVATFVGHAFLATDRFAPLLRFGPGASNLVVLQRNLAEVPESEWPTHSVAGMLHAAAGHIGKGRVVVLGEGAACTAQRFGRQPAGMNHPAATQNPQFCLNAVRWLARVLED